MTKQLPRALEVNLPASVIARDCADRSAALVGLRVNRNRYLRHRVTSFSDSLPVSYKLRCKERKGFAT